MLEGVVDVVVMVVVMVLAKEAQLEHGGVPAGRGQGKKRIPHRPMLLTEALPTHHKAWGVSAPTCVGCF